MKIFFDLNSFSIKQLKYLYLTNFYILLKIFVWNNSLNSILLGSWKSFYILDFKKFFIFIKWSTFFIKKILHLKGRIVFVGSPSLTGYNNFQLLKKFLFINKHLYLDVWKPGLLTNLVSINKTAQKFFWLKKKNRQVFNFFKNYQMTCFLKSRPNLIIILNAEDNLFALKEARKFNIPTIALVHDISLLKYIDYPIICNNKSIFFLYFYVNFLLLTLIQENLSFFSKSVKIKKFSLKIK